MTDHKVAPPTSPARLPSSSCNTEESSWWMSMVQALVSTRQTDRDKVFAFPHATSCIFTIPLRVSHFRGSSSLIFSSHCSTSSHSTTQEPSSSKLTTKNKIRNYSSSPRSSVRAWPTRAVTDCSHWQRTRFSSDSRTWPMLLMCQICRRWLSLIWPNQWTWMTSLMTCTWKWTVTWPTKSKSPRQICRVYIAFIRTISGVRCRPERKAWPKPSNNRSNRHQLTKMTSRRFTLVHNRCAHLKLSTCRLHKKPSLRSNKRTHRTNWEPRSLWRELIAINWIKNEKIHKKINQKWRIKVIDNITNIFDWSWQIAYICDFHKYK